MSYNSNPNTSAKSLKDALSCIDNLTEAAAEVAAIFHTYQVLVEETGSNRNALPPPGSWQDQHHFPHPSPPDPPQSQLRRGMGSLVLIADAKTKNHKKVKHFATKVVYIHTAISNAKSCVSIAKKSLTL